MTFFLSLFARRSHGAVDAVARPRSAFEPVGRVAAVWQEQAIELEPRDRAASSERLSPPGDPRREPPVAPSHSRERARKDAVDEVGAADASSGGHPVIHAAEPQRALPPAGERSSRDEPIDAGLDPAASANAEGTRRATVARPSVRPVGSAPMPAAIAIDERADAPERAAPVAATGQSRHEANVVRVEAASAHVASPPPAARHEGLERHVPRQSVAAVPARSRIDAPVTPPAPTVEVIIGRLEVRAVVAPAPVHSPAPREPAPQAMGLAQYLREREARR